MPRRLLSLFVLIGCSVTQGNAPSGADEKIGSKADAAQESQLAPLPVSDSDLAALSQSINAFSHDLYGQIARNDGNLIVSPASIAVALGMTYQGTTDDTAAEFKSVLHVEGMEPSQWHAALGELAQRWMTRAPAAERDGPAPEVALANRLFGAEGVPFKDAFLRESARDYRAPMERLDFAASDLARVHINRWVAGRTRDRIRDLIPADVLTKDTLLVLANAIYFKARWQERFNQASTHDAVFAVKGEERLEVPTMRVTKDFKYTAQDDATVVELPYANSSFAMTLAMPRDPDGLGALEASLEADSVARWSSAMKYQRLALSLPKFKIEPRESIELSEPLRALGLNRAFTDSAQFEGMAAPQDERLKIDKVFHKGFIEVDENGTEAAAATSVVMMRAGSLPGDPVRVAFDRPFLFFVRDTDTGAILFMGRIVDPR
ncbi:MAG: serpin family protein [Nannocystaceae bacterium]|nr:serpin family protein [Nannocystaceae bacterium]